MRRLILIICALCALGSASRADSLCVGGGANFPRPSHQGPGGVTFGPYCAPIP